MWLSCSRPVKCEKSRTLRQKKNPYKFWKGTANSKNVRSNDKNARQWIIFLAPASCRSLSCQRLETPFLASYLYKNQSVTCTPKTLSSKLSQRKPIYFLLIILNGVTVSITILYFRDKAKVINSLKKILKFEWAKCIILSSIRLASIGTLGIVSYRLV